MRRLVVGLLLAAIGLMGCSSSSPTNSSTRAPDGSGPTSEDDSTTTAQREQVNAPLVATDVERCEDVEVPQTSVEGSFSSIGRVPTDFTETLHRYIAENLETYGGGYFATSQGSTFVIAFTDDPAHHFARIAELTLEDGSTIGERPDLAFGVIQVEHSERDLFKYRDELVDGLADFEPNTGISESKNRLILYVADPPSNLFDSYEGVVPASALCFEQPK